MQLSRRQFLRTAPIGVTAIGTSGSLAGCLGLLDSGSGSGNQEPIAADRFEDGSFDYHFDTGNSTEHDWGTRERSDVPGDGSVVGYVTQQSSGLDHSVEGFANETFDLTGAESLEFQFYAASYEPGPRGNEGSFVLWSEDEVTSLLSCRLLSTDNVAGYEGFLIKGEQIDDIRSTGPSGWEQDRWYRVKVAFESSGAEPLARGKMWDPVSGSEPDEYQAETVLAEPIEGQYRPGFRVSGGSAELSVEYDYWSVY